MANPPATTGRQNPSHTFGTKCRLAPLTRPWTQKEDEPPPIQAQYFYSSSISIDDPVSASLPVGSAESKVSRSLLRPFSRGDNNAIERAWLSIADDGDRKNHQKATKGPSGNSTLESPDDESLSRLIRTLSRKHSIAHASPETTDSRPNTPATPAPPDTDDAPIPVCCPDLAVDVDRELSRLFCPLVRARYHVLRNKNVVQGIMMHVRAQSIEEMELSVAPAYHPRPLSNDGMSGKPFARLATSPDGQHSIPSSPRRAEFPVDPRVREQPCGVYNVPGPGRDEDDRLKLPENDNKKAAIEVPVGVSRLHMVSLPRLQMAPIYWSPVNDIAKVLRATWFYRETMVPVDPVVANLLETGYQELRPYTETWRDELCCAVEVGPLGEEKVVYRLWPDGHGKDCRDSEPMISRDTDCAARCYRGEASTEGHCGRAELNGDNPVLTKPFSNYHVVYKDVETAYLLKPSLRPSAYYGRKPVAKIVRGCAVGVPVQRGFDWGMWDMVQEKKGEPQLPSQPISAAAKLQRGAMSDACQACKLDRERSQIMDLVFVAHGIGQKFAEKVESFHFTHAINAFRREVNIELGSPAVKSVLRKGHNGIMVLPINWRHSLSFGDGGPMREEDKSSCVPEGFSLKDIEATSIPAVRSIISDIMFDIPFYMSHHKQKMIEALVTEANRVYRLWCRNNPGFAEKGRVHLVGHSLGSAMALEVLSKQPTEVPRLSLDDPRRQTSFFEFDTKNLFLLGSPAGFFLLLERGTLKPRRARLKPGANPLDVESKDIVSEAGLFGCLAVDNVYNILAKEDPIAYLLNATIDPAYAASLRMAYIPSATSSIFKSIGDAVRKLVPGAPLASDSQATTVKPPNVRLPSQLELEVHDFTREEIAEKKAYLLNDNGQIDFYLRSGGGPLEIQYLNMLSAHTSYWAHQDLVRILCMEIGREPGRENTLPSLRAVKSTQMRMTVAVTT